MTRQGAREIARYQCEDDDGNRYDVIEYQHYLVTEAMGRETEEKGTHIERRLADGHHIEVVGEGTFKILETDTIIRKL